MSEFRLNLTVEVDQVANALAIQTPVPMQVTYDRGKWQAFCADPPVTTDNCEEMQEAIVCGARQIATELQAAVYERPLVFARITPDDVPPGRF